MTAQLPVLPDTDLTLGFAEELVELSKKAGSDDLRRQADLLFIDFLGTCLRGTMVPWGEAAAKRADRFEDTGGAIVFGTGAFVAPEVAAFANAVAAHGMELDDTHDASISHPGAVVFSTALAVAAETGPDLATFLGAVIAGYEAMARAGMATGAEDIIQHGFHPTALFGGFGAATAAAILHGLNAEEMARAWGLMLSGIGGSMQFSEDPHGTTVKRLHAAYGARAGVTAVELAQLGLSGPVDALSGRYGFCRIFGKKPDLAHLKGRRTERPEILNISIKPYPCCRLFHSTLDALAELTDGFTLDPKDIASFRVGGSTIVVTQHMVRRPTSVMAAQYNLPHIVGAALLYGPAAYEGYTEDKLDKPELLEIADKVDAFISDDLNDAFPARCGSDVTLTLKDGSIRHTLIMDSIGTPERPMDMSQVRGKLAGLLPDPTISNALDDIQGILDGPSDHSGFDQLLDAIARLVTTNTTKSKD